MEQQKIKRACIVVVAFVFVFILGVVVMHMGYSQTGLGILCIVCIGYGMWFISFAGSYDWSTEYQLNNEDYKTKEIIPSIMVFCPYGCDRLQAIPLNRFDGIPSYYPREKEHKCTQCSRVFRTLSHLHLVKKEGE